MAPSELFKESILYIIQELQKMKSPYEVITSSASYAPWLIDSDFREIYSKIKDYTLIDEYRCYELWTLVEQAAKLESGYLIEIGVWRGGTGAIIAKQAARYHIPSNVYLCDTFTGVVKAGEQDSSYHGGEHSDADKKSVEELLRQLNITNVEVKVGVFPEDTGKQIEGQRFRFCHIDVDVYQSAADILTWIWPRLVPGGIIVYDDYGFQTCDGITKHVNEQLLLKDRIVIHNLNGHTIVIKL